MTRTLRLLPTYLIRLSILLTFASPFAAFADGSCSNLFLRPQSTFTAVLQLSNSQNFAIEKWHKAFSKIKTYDELQFLFTAIERKRTKLTELDFFALQQIDMVDVVSKLSPSDIQQLKLKVHGVKQRIDKQAALTLLDHWLLPLDMHFHPENTLDFILIIKNISLDGLNVANAFAGEYGLRSFNKTLSRVLNELPQNIHERVEKNLKTQMDQISLTGELMTMNHGQLYIPQMRNYRRNLEVIAALVQRRYFIELKKSLEQNSSRDNVIMSVNTFYGQIKKTLATGRGGYNFDKVVRAAEILKQSFAYALNDSNLTVDMYGSFANGKAAFQTSDIDIKFSPALLESLTGRSSAEIRRNEPFSLYFVDMVDREKSKLPVKFFKFWDHFQEAEKSLGHSIFERPPTRPSELLTSLYPPREYTNDSTDYRWYNPLVLKISNDQVTLQLHDLMGELTTLEVIIR